MKQALQLAPKLLILVGSSNVAPDTRNPFTFEQRRDMILNAIDAEGLLDRVTVQPLPDFAAPNEWIERVQHLVSSATATIRPRVCLVGHERDFTSEYLRWFPQYANEFLDDQGGINATSIRNVLFSGIQAAGGPTLDKLCPPTVVQFLSDWSSSVEAMRLRDEQASEIQYRKEWGPGPHVTADAVVIKAGHVLLIKRGRLPGKGMWALPGGFLDMSKNETMKQAAIRELIEETRIRLSLHPEDTVKALERAFVASHVADDPNRSRRARIITHAFLFALDTDSYGLPPVRGSDDAAEAKWVPLSEIRHDELFEDHGKIIDILLRRL